MGGIAGLWNLDDAPVDEAFLERMAQPITHRGPDGIGYWANKAIGLITFHSWTTPESVGEEQPLIDRSENLCLTLHGRVDNREELRTMLGLQPAEAADCTDADLILQAYQHWGEKCPQKIIGEFAFAIWDARQQHLFCARDMAGWKPFFYYRDRSKFVWASEFPPFFEVEGVPKVPNEGRVADYLTYSMSSRDETLYEGIFRLPPAHTLIVTRDDVQLSPYWGLDSIQDVHYRTDAEYAEHFREVFQQAVQSQLRVNGRLGSDLSGGLDSSSVVSVAVPLLNDRQRQQFEVFSMSFPGTDFDETHYIRDVVDKWNLKANLIEPRQHPIPDPYQQARQYQYIPNYPNGSMGDALYQLAREKGFSVLLTGAGGDEWFTGSNYCPADLLRNFQWLTLFRYLRAETQASDDNLMDILRYSLLRRGISPLVSPSIKRVLRQFRRRPIKIPEWINQQFAERIHLIERNTRNIFAERKLHSFARIELFQSIATSMNIHTYEMEERYAATFNVELRQPFHSQPIIEFGLGIPEAQRRRDGTTKYVLRQAMQGILPESVRQRQTKAEFSAVMPPAMEALGGRSFFDNLQTEQRGWVLSAPLQARYSEMEYYWNEQDDRYKSMVWDLWLAMALEVWFHECLSPMEQ